MSDTTPTVTVHEEYALAVKPLKSVRDCMRGSFIIKSGANSKTYLPHPSQVDTTSDMQVNRYANYLAGAEFDEFPDETRRELLGKMRLSNSVVELPDGIKYLLNNTDGDGTNAQSSIEFAVNNVLQTKWHLLVAEYKNAPKDISGLSKAEAASLNMRAVIKQYTRENIVNWNFSRVNGVLQLSYIKLMEVTQDFNQSTGDSEEVQKYLTLALDEEGNYYQAVSEGDAVVTIEMRDYPMVSGAMLDRIPVVFAADEELPSDSLPLQLGYLYGICDATLHRYIVSAKYKECQTGNSPSKITSGWKQGDMEIFKEANNNRDYIATGPIAVTNLPEGITMDVISGAAEMTDYHTYFEANEKKIMMKGGAVNGSNVTMTATEADMNASKQNAFLSTIAATHEEAFTIAFYWCGVFEGLYQVNNEADYNRAMEDITVELPRDFATPKLTVEEVKEYREQLMSSAISRKMFIEKLIKGGWYEGEINEILATMEEQPPVG